MTQFGLSQIQSQAILDMQLQRLTGLERQKILDELAEILKLIERLRAILSSDKLLLEIIVSELRHVVEKYGDDRRTEILPEAGEFRALDLIVEEDMAITVTNTGYIKRTAITNYRNQRRGGKGRIGMRTREEDFVSHLFVASTHAYIMIFSDRGRAYWLKVHEIPDVGPDGRGKAIANLVSMQEGERIAALLTVREFEDDKFIVMGTKRGEVKKTELSAFSNPRAGGIIAMDVEEGDAVIAVQVSEGSNEIFIGTRNGMSIRFREGDVRSMGRTAGGVRGIELRDEDEVVAMEVLQPGGTILSVTEQGYGKRTELEEYRLQTRGGVGIINIQTSDRNGKVIGVAQVSDDAELMLITQQGKILRMASKDIRTIGRATQGVRLIDIEGDDRAVSIARLAEKDEEEPGAPQRTAASRLTGTLVGAARAQPAHAAAAALLPRQAVRRIRPASAEVRNSSTPVLIVEIHPRHDVRAPVQEPDVGSALLVGHQSDPLAVASSPVPEGRRAEPGPSSMSHAERRAVGSLMRSPIRRYSPGVQRSQHQARALRVFDDQLFHPHRFAGLLRRRTRRKRHDHRQHGEDDGGDLENAQLALQAIHLRAHRVELVRHRSSPCGHRHRCP